MQLSSFSFADIDPSVIQELTQFEDYFGKLCDKDIVLVAYEKEPVCQNTKA
ncbi:MAG: hypothetical protein HFI90_06750 [Clostridia bacterium]|nr:hypothetical protein [Clostridia bacterium]